MLVHTDVGITGIGECDINPWIAKACIEAPGSHTMGMGLKDMLIGEDPRSRKDLGKALHGQCDERTPRSGDIAQFARLTSHFGTSAARSPASPCWKLLGQPGKEFITPYASLQPRGSTLQEYKDSLVAWAVRAKEAGFRREDGGDSQRAVQAQRIERAR